MHPYNPELPPNPLCSYSRVSWWATTDVEFKNLDFQATDISDGLFSLKCTNESKMFRFRINYAWLHLGSWSVSRAYRLIGIPHKQSWLWAVVFPFHSLNWLTYYSAFDYGSFDTDHWWLARLFDEQKVVGSIPILLDQCQALSEELAACGTNGA